MASPPITIISKETTTIASNAPISHETNVDGVLVRLLPRAPYCAVFTPSRLIVGFAFDIQSGTHAFASDRIVPFVTRPATAAVTPAGCDVYSTSRRGGEYLTVEIANPDVLGLADEKVVVQSAQTNLAIPQTNRVARRLRARLVAEQSTTFDVSELALELAAKVLEATSNGPPKRERGSGSLTDARLRKLDDFVEAHLGTRITVAQMAAAVGLQPYFFCEPFEPQQAQPLTLTFWSDASKWRVTF